MSYNPKSHMALLDAALRKLSPGDFIIANNPTFINAAIRVTSSMPFGHGILYMGRKSSGGLYGLEVPLRLETVSHIFSPTAKHGATHSAAFVHCKGLSQEQRTRILGIALEFYNDKKKAGSDGYDRFGALLHASGSIAASIHIGIVENIPGSRQVSEALGVDPQDVRDLTALPATIYGEASAMVKRFPNLTCSGLISFAHAVAGNIIVKGSLRDAHTTSPRDLWNAIQQHGARYSVEEIEFS